MGASWRWFTKVLFFVLICVTVGILHAMTGELFAVTVPSSKLTIERGGQFEHKPSPESRIKDVKKIQKFTQQHKVHQAKQKPQGHSRGKQKVMSPTLSAQMSPDVTQPLQNMSNTTGLPGNNYMTEQGRCVDYHVELHDRAPVNVLGVNLDGIRERLLDPPTPLSFLKEFKNPCWIEKLPATFKKDYEAAPWYPYGKKEIMRIIPTFENRLKSSAPWRLRCLPYVYLAGVTKSGTTDMYDTLTLHPDVQIPWVKEYMFWNKRRYPKGAISHQGRANAHTEFEKFVTQFDDAAYRINKSRVQTKCGTRHNGITIDGSSYLFWEDNGWEQDPLNAGFREPAYTNADALHEAQPTAKIIVLMREPASRVHSAFSMYIHERGLHFNKNRTTPQHFHEFVESGIAEYKNCFREHGIRACAYNASLSCRLHPISLRPSLYSVFLEDWLKAFGKDQILVIKSEDYYTDRLASFDVVRKFLDLKPVSEKIRRKIRSKRASMKRKYSKMLPHTKRLLQDFYAPFNKELQILLGRKMW